ncbi:MAG TPA: response regulator [Usitatibacter sp.]|nr:response regulator [Usitatibacter sp.]
MVQKPVDGPQTRAHRPKPDVVLLDIRLPDVNGYEVARQLRADPSTQNLQLVALTGFGRREDILRARAAGFDEHITKPTDPEELARVIGLKSAKGVPPA